MSDLTRDTTTNVFVHLIKSCLSMKLVMLNHLKLMIYVMNISK